MVSGPIAAQPRIQAALVPVAAGIAALVDRVDVVDGSLLARFFVLALGPVAMLVLSLAPGLAAAAVVPWRDPVVLIAVALGASGIAGWVTFWCWLASPSFGPVWSLVVLACSAVVLWVRRSWSPGPGLVGAVGVAAAVVTLAVSLSAFDAGTGRGLRAEAINETLWLVEDNRLPRAFSDRLADGPPPNVAPISGDWLSSDRPPLQTGLHLMVRKPATGGTSTARSTPPPSQST